LISSHDLAVLTTVVDTWIAYIIAVLALVNTVIDIVVFYQLGYKDTTSITMTGIALWDLLKLSCVLIIKCYGPMGLVSPALGKSWESVTFPSMTFLQFISSNVAYVIAGYVAIERCLCVSIPFKVKTILTPKFTVIILMGISITVFVSLMPMMMIFEFVWIFSEEYNATIAIYQYSPFYFQHGGDFLRSYKTCNFLYPSLSFVAMVTSTVIIASSLYKASRFRNRSASIIHALGKTKSQPEMTTRDKKTVKMLFVVILIYIFCLAPRFAHFMATLLVSEYYYLRYYHNIFWVIVYMVVFLDIVNAASHFFVFFVMGTSFRKTFKQTFFRAD
ncbi:unnamed protein product, partial [Lymnaea stagnalis]